MFYLVLFAANLFILLVVIVFLYQQGARLLKWICAQIDAMPSAMDPAQLKKRIEPRFTRKVPRAPT
jgi:hypothetical protein